MNAATYYKDPDTGRIPWTIIAKSLGTGRTAKQCQTRYGILMKKKAKEEAQIATKKAEVAMNNVMVGLKEFTLGPLEEVEFDSPDEIW
jgi:hypothetical protein